VGKDCRGPEARRSASHGRLRARRSTQSLAPTADVQIIYAILCLVGTALPLAQFVPWLRDHGLSVPLLVAQATETSIAAFAWSDVVVTGVVVAVFVLVEGRRINMRHAWTSLIGLVVGPSLSLPLFLLLRERHLAAVGADTSLEWTRDK